MGRSRPRTSRRHPDWRWRKAKRLLRQPDADALRDDVWLRHAHELLAARQARSIPNLRGDIRGALQWAERFHKHGGLQRDVLEARMLALEPIADIAQRSQIDRLFVTAYEHVFFDCDDFFLKADVVMQRAVRWPQNPHAPVPVGAVLRKFGYCLGSQLLEAMIVALARSGGELLTKSLPDVTTQGGRTEMAIRKLLALEQLPIRERTTLHLAEWAHDLLLNEQDPGDEPIKQPAAAGPIVNAARVKRAKAAPQICLRRTG